MRVRIRLPRTRAERFATGISLIFVGVLLFLVAGKLGGRLENTCNIDDVASLEYLKNSSLIEGQNVITGEITKNNFLGSFDTGNLLEEPEYYCFISTKKHGIVTVNITNQEQINTLKNIEAGSDETVPLAATVVIIDTKQKQMAKIALVNKVGCSQEQADKAMNGCILKNSSAKPKNTTNVFNSFALLTCVLGAVMFVPEIINLINKIREQ